MSASRVAKVAYVYVRHGCVVDIKATGMLIPYEVYFRLAGPPVKVCWIVVNTDSPEVAVKYVLSRFPGAQLLERALGAAPRPSLAPGPKRFTSYTHGRELAPCLERTA